MLSAIFNIPLPFFSVHDSCIELRLFSAKFSKVISLSFDGGKLSYTSPNARFVRVILFGLKIASRDYYKFVHSCIN